MNGNKGCMKKLAKDQWWGFCGETDMGQSLPALCTECGGMYKLNEDIKMNNERITIKDAMNRLKIAMIEEPYYAHAWNRNIAQACYESMPIAKTNEQNRLDHKIANESATTFMKRFFDVETSKDMLKK